MSTAILERLRDERADIEKFVEQSLASVEGRDLSDAEMRTVNDSKARISQIDAQIAPLADFLSAKASAADLTSVLSRGARTSSPAAQAEMRSMGEAFVESESIGAIRDVAPRPG